MLMVSGEGPAGCGEGFDGALFADGNAGGGATSDQVFGWR